MKTLAILFAATVSWMGFAYAGEWSSFFPSNNSKPFVLHKSWFQFMGKSWIDPEFKSSASACNELVTQNESDERLASQRGIAGQVKKLLSSGGSLALERAIVFAWVINNDNVGVIEGFAEGGGGREYIDQFKPTPGRDSYLLMRIYKTLWLINDLKTKKNTGKIKITEHEFGLLQYIFALRAGVEVVP